MGRLGIEFIEYVANRLLVCSIRTVFLGTSLVPWILHITILLNASWWWKYMFPLLKSFQRSIADYSLNSRHAVAAQWPTTSSLWRLPDVARWITYSKWFLLATGYTFSDHRITKDWRQEITDLPRKFQQPPATFGKHPKTRNIFAHENRCLPSVSCENSMLLSRLHQNLYGQKHLLYQSISMSNTFIL